MRLRRLPLVVLSLAAIAMTIGLLLLRSSPASRAARERAALADVGSSAEGAGRAVTVDVRTVRAEPVRLEAELAAILAPVRRVRIAAEVEGRVVEVPVEEHTSVESGAVLVQVERRLLEAAADRARAVVGRARANYELAQIELERQRGLAERSVGSEAELDRASSTERASLAELREAEAALADATVRLAKSAVRAPFAGVVCELDLEPGSYLRPGEHVAELLDLSEIEIEVGLTDREVVAVHEGDRAEVRVDVFPAARFTGEVRRVARAPQADTQKYAVQVRVPNPDGTLLAGMLGRVRFELGDPRRAIRIPRRATQKEFDVAYVFVVDGSPPAPRVERRQIVARPVPFRPDLVEVAKGLRDGERIAVSRVGDLRDGLRVSVAGAQP